jgi:RNA polymerase sigma-70 factor (ECF subfamily)
VLGRSPGKEIPVSRADKLLVARIVDGDREAFREFFDEQFPRLLVRLDHDEDTAEDVAQSTLCKAMRKLETYKGEAPLFSWLCTFCRHELWARGREPHQVDLIEDSPELRAAVESLAAGDESDPEASLRRAQTARLVQATLDRLPTRYGNVLEWKYIRGHSVNEIADLLGVGPKAAESMLTRAREAFRDAFGAMTREALGRQSP